MGPADVRPSAAIAAGGAGVGKFPQRKLSGDLKLRLARLPSLGGEGVGGDGKGGGGRDASLSRLGGACSSRRERTEGLGVRRFEVLGGEVSVESICGVFPGVFLLEAAAVHHHHLPCSIDSSEVEMLVFTGYGVRVF